MKSNILYFPTVNHYARNSEQGLLVLLGVVNKHSA